MAEGRLKEARTFFTEGNKTSDAVIQVENHELHVDLNIISLVSSTLPSEFQPRPDPNSPPGENNKAVAKLVGQVDHIVDMLTSVYPNFRKVNIVNKHNVEYLLPLALKYKLMFLQQTCETVIVEKLPKLNYSTQESMITNDLYSNSDKKDRLMRYFLLADKHKLVNMRKQCMDKLVKCRYSTSVTTIRSLHSKESGTRSTEAFQQLDPTTRWEILRNRLFFMEGTYGKVTDNVEDL